MLCTRPALILPRLRSGKSSDRGHNSFKAEVAAAFSQVSLNNVLNYYSKCLLQVHSER